MASGWAHPADGRPMTTWSPEVAAAAIPPAHVHKDKGKEREKQIEKVSRARVHLTDKLAQASLLRPDPEVVAKEIRAAKRARTGQ